MFMILEVAALVLAACDPGLTALFTPRHPQLGRYEVCTTAQPIGEAAGPSATIEALDPLDAFGAEADYDRSRLARLYGGTRARVARRWSEANGRFESDTFISPYPDAALGRLEPGTMVIRWVLETENLEVRSKNQEPGFQFSVLTSWLQGSPHPPSPRRAT